MSSKIFYLISPFFILLFFVDYFIDPLGDQSSVFFLQTQDIYADFFNTLRYIADKNPYFNSVGNLQDHNYLPLSYLILFPFTKVCDYSNMTLQDCYTCTSALGSLLIYSLFGITTYFLALNSFLKCYDYKKSFMLICAFSSIFLFSIERGNLVILTAAFFIYFLSYYNSDSKKLRYFALTSLCIAAILKIYPVIFGLLLLKDRRYKDILFCIVLSFVLAIVPFTFFENGLDNIPQLIHNLQAHSAGHDYKAMSYCYSISHIIYYVMSVNEYSTPETIDNAAYVWGRIPILILIFISVIAFFKAKERWKEFLLLEMILLYFPISSNLYCGLYFLPVIGMILAENKDNRFYWIYSICFAIILCPFQICCIKGYGGTFIFANIAIMIIWILTLTSIIKECINFSK